MRLQRSSRQHIAPPPPQSLPIEKAAAKYGWDLSSKNDFSNDKRVKELPISSIRRPLGGVRKNDQEKVDILKESISKIGLLEPIDVLEVDGIYYGFSGCHRFQAHQELGCEKILCRIRKATPTILKYHMM